MFIKPFPKYNKTKKERYTIYRLCESYRPDDLIRHHTIIGFGKLGELLKVKNNDNYLWIKSHTKALKENSMNGLLSQGFEEGIQKIDEGTKKRGGHKKA